MIAAASEAGLNLHDILESTLGVALVFSFMGMMLARIGRDWHRPRPVKVTVVVDRRVSRLATRESRVVLPVRRRTRRRYDGGVTIDWSAASPQERAEAVLAVLPLHYEDSSGITATDVAHRVGLTRGNRVAATLTVLVGDGRARAHWEMHRGHKRRAYWRTGSPS